MTSFVLLSRSHVEDHFDAIGILTFALSPATVSIVT